MNILITGGSGFIGTHLINHFLNKIKSVEIHNVDLKHSTIADERLTTVIGDVRHMDFGSKLPKGINYDVCVHLAALCKEPGFEWDEYFETNHVGTQNVIEYCEQLDIKQIIFTSTMMVYKAGEVQRTEESITSPDTAYGISKLLGEQELASWKAGGEDRKLKIIRPAVVFGENENANFTRLYKSLKKGFFPYVGKSSTIKSSIYVKEVVYFIDFLIAEKTPTDVFNFSFPENSSIKTTINQFKDVFAFKSLNPVLPYRLLLLVARGFEVLNALGIKNSIHHRRIQKLYFSTDIYPENAINSGYKFEFSLKSALEDWKMSGDPNIASD